MQNDIEKLKSCVEILEREVSLLHERIYTEKKYRLEDSIRISHLIGELSRRMRHIDTVIIFSLVGLVIHCLSHVLKWYGI